MGAAEFLLLQQVADDAKRQADESYRQNAEIAEADYRRRREREMVSFDLNESGQRLTMTRAEARVLWEMLGRFVRG